MGAFNEIRCSIECPACHRAVDVNVQFKYGSTAQHMYVLGDTLLWGGNDIGVPGESLVVLDGEATGCPQCGYNHDWPVYVFVRNGILDHVMPSTDMYDFVATQTSFLVLDASSCPVGVGKR